MVPSPRPRVTGRGTFMPTTYRRHCAKLAASLAYARGLLEAGHFREASPWQSAGPMRLDLAFWAPKQSGDLDNAAKTVMDAGQLHRGEAPGAEEEIQGEPFVGPAGQLLTKMIQGMGLKRSDVYIGNIMNWRPDLPTPAGFEQIGNRPPTEEEIRYCLPYLRAQIEVVNPALIVALGKTAAEGLMGFGAVKTLGDVRGRWNEFAGRALMVTYHPSYILREPTNRKKRMIWEDLLQVMERAALPISDRQRGYFLDK
jgi:uracil-DNA glycosylase family 4